MRPPRTPQSPLAMPLNALLGTEANVRLLRVLAQQASPMTPTELARRAGLDPAGGRRAITRLLALGIARTIGAGRRPQVQWQATHPLASALQALFQAEADRMARILIALSQAGQALTPALDAVWIEPHDAAAPGAALQVWLVTTSAQSAEVERQYRQALDGLEAAVDLTIEIHVLTRPDLKALSSADRARVAASQAVYGLPADVLLGVRRTTPGGRPRTHADADTRALALGRALGQRLRTHPEMLPQAQAWITTRLRVAGPQERVVLEEWQTLLATTSIPRLQRLLVDPGERATRLRQSLPFMGALSPAERDAIFAAAASA